MATAAAAPKAHPGERLANYFDNFFKTIVGISTFGASICFSKIVQTPVVPWVDYGISRITVQNYLALSWLFFVLDLGLCSFAASALSLWRPQAIQYFGTSDSHDRRIVMWYATVVSTTLFGLVTAAFIFLGLVVVAYAGPTGWAAIALTILFAVIGLGIIVWQSPIGTPPPKAEPDPWRMSQEDSLEKLDRQAHQPQYTGDASRRYAGENTQRYTGNDYVREDYGLKNQYGRDEWQQGEADEVVYKDGTTVVREEFVGDGLSRRSTLVRPVSVVIPDYTSDLRRYRALKGSGDYSHFDGREG